MSELFELRKNLRHNIKQNQWHKTKVDEKSKTKKMSVLHKRQHTVAAIRK